MILKLNVFRFTNNIGYFIDYKQVMAYDNSIRTGNGKIKVCCEYTRSVDAVRDNLQLYL